MFDFYKVTAFHETALSPVKNVLTRLFNAFISAMNQKDKHLPRMILMVPDWDILKFINHYSYGITAFSGKCIDWLLINMERMIESRKEQLRKRRAGSVCPK